jgi:hypothetical protein
MATPNYNINYNDARFKAVTNEKNTALNNINNVYNNMINSSDKFYQDQIEASKDYARTQSEIQQANTDFAIEKIEQQKDQSRKDYIKEQTGAYTDWQKQSNQYGANAEQMASQGLVNTGYSESSQVSMYNTYQNRISTARDSFNRATLEYDNAIKEAQLANNSVLADIAYKALQTQLELSLQGFQYKNTLLQTQINEQQETEDRYHQRWQDVLSQINTENSLKEQVRQFEAQMAYQKERDRIKDQQWQKEYELSLASRYSSGGGGGGGSRSSGGSSGGGGYSSGVVAYGNLANSYGDGKGNVIYVDKNGNKYKMKQGYNPYTGTINPDAKKGTFSNGYQPDNIGGKKLKSVGKMSNGRNIWEANGKKYYWDGQANRYYRY